jgi:tRNA U34 5-methylaminomethyl-2-thiouridine-forming methyltransferase MnmC
MENRIIQTADGSKTIELPEWNESYHSRHGAWQESQHVFIKMGLGHFPRKAIKVLEMGFGTGLNAIQCLQYAEDAGLSIEYHTLEAYPLEMNEWEAMQYDTLLSEPRQKEYYRQMHTAPWNEFTMLGSHFHFVKYQRDIRSFLPDCQPDLVFYDAFGPRVQPELWTAEIFKRLYDLMADRGVLTTYCAKGEVRRHLQKIGFEVERLPGPPGKREMLRATKIL